MNKLTTLATLALVGTVAASPPQPAALYSDLFVDSHGDDVITKSFPATLISGEKIDEGIFDPMMSNIYIGDGSCDETVPQVFKAAEVKVDSVKFVGVWGKLFKLQFLGYGLSAADSFKIVPAGGACTDANLAFAAPSGIHSAIIEEARYVTSYSTAMTPASSDLEQDYLVCYQFNGAPTFEPLSVFHLPGVVVGGNQDTDPGVPSEELRPLMEVVNKGFGGDDLVLRVNNGYYLDEINDQVVVLDAGAHAACTASTVSSALSAPVTGADNNLRHIEFTITGLANNHPELRVCFHDSLNDIWIDVGTTSLDVELNAEFEHVDTGLMGRIYVEGDVSTANNAKLAEGDCTANDIISNTAQGNTLVMETGEDGEEKYYIDFPGVIPNPVLHKLCVQLAAGMPFNEVADIVFSPIGVDNIDPFANQVGYEVSLNSYFSLKVSGLGISSTNEVAIVDGADCTGTIVSGPLALMMIDDAGEVEVTPITGPEKLYKICFRFASGDTWQLVSDIDLQNPLPIDAGVAVEFTTPQIGSQLTIFVGSPLAQNTNELKIVENAAGKSCADTGVPLTLTNGPNAQAFETLYSPPAAGDYLICFREGNTGPFLEKGMFSLEQHLFAVGQPNMFPRTGGIVLGDRNIFFYGTGLQTSDRIKLVPDNAADCSGAGLTGFDGVLLTNVNVAMEADVNLPQEVQEARNMFQLGKSRGEYHISVDGNFGVLEANDVKVCYSFDNGPFLDTGIVLPKLKNGPRYAIYGNDPVTLVGESFEFDVVGGGVSASDLARLVAPYVDCDDVAHVPAASMTENSPGSIRVAVTFADTDVALSPNGFFKICYQLASTPGDWEVVKTGKTFPGFKYDNSMEEFSSAGGIILTDKPHVLCATDDLNGPTELSFVVHDMSGNGTTPTMPPTNTTMPPPTNTTMPPPTNTTMPPPTNTTMPPPTNTTMPPTNTTMPPPTNNSTMPPPPAGNGTAPPPPAGNGTMPPPPAGNETMPPIDPTNQPEAPGNVILVELGAAGEFVSGHVDAEEFVDFHEELPDLVFINNGDCNKRRRFPLVVSTVPSGPGDDVDVELLANGEFKLKIHGTKLTPDDIVKLVGLNIPCDVVGSALESENNVTAPMPDADGMEYVYSMPINAFGGDGGEYQVCYRRAGEPDFHPIGGEPIEVPEYKIKEDVKLLDVGWESGDLHFELDGFGFNSNFDHFGLISPAHDCNMVQNMTTFPVVAADAESATGMVQGIVLPGHYKICYYMDNLNTTISVFPYTEAGVLHLDQVVDDVEFKDFVPGVAGEIVVKGTGLGPQAKAKVVRGVDLDTASGDCNAAIDFASGDATGEYLTATPGDATRMTVTREYVVIESQVIFLCVSLTAAEDYLVVSDYYTHEPVVHTIHTAYHRSIEDRNVLVEGGVLNFTVYGEGLTPADQVMIVPSHLNCTNGGPVTNVEDVDAESRKGSAFLSNLPVAGEYKVCYKSSSDSDFHPRHEMIYIDSAMGLISAHSIGQPIVADQLVNISVWINDVSSIATTEFFAFNEPCDGQMPNATNSMPLPLVSTDEHQVYFIEFLSPVPEADFHFCGRKASGDPVEEVFMAGTMRFVGEVNFGPNVQVPSFGMVPPEPDFDEVVVSGFGLKMGDKLSFVPAGLDCAADFIDGVAELMVDRIEEGLWHTTNAIFKFDLTQTSPVELLNLLADFPHQACVKFDGEMHYMPAGMELQLKRGSDGIELTPMIPVAGEHLQVRISGTGFSDYDLVSVHDAIDGCNGQPLFVANNETFWVEDGDVVLDVPPLPPFARIMFCMDSPSSPGPKPIKVPADSPVYTLVDDEFVLDPYGFLVAGMYDICGLYPGAMHPMPFGLIDVAFHDDSSQPPVGPPTGPRPPPNGNGTFSFEDGSAYDGETLDGTRHGKGKMIYVNGDVFEGEFAYGTKTGPGKRIFAAGPAASIEGRYENGVRVGPGVLTFRSGLRFTGEFNKDGIQGEGELELPSGDKYLGNYVNNKRVGTGRFVRADGLVQEINWEEDPTVPKPGEGPMPEHTEYLGCVPDGPMRDLKHMAFHVMTPVNETIDLIAECEFECREDGFHFMGIQRGSECYCGNDYGTLQLEGDDEIFRDEEECDFPCGGALEDSGLFCGGDWRNSVYRIGAINFDPTWEPEDDNEGGSEDDVEVPEEEPAV